MRGEATNAAGGSPATRAGSWLGVTLAAIAGGCMACTGHGSAAVSPAPPPPVVAAPADQSPPPPTPATPCGPRDREWDSWFGSVFGDHREVIYHGPDPKYLNNLGAGDRERAAIMLRRGLRACDQFAVEAIQRAGWRELLPDLEQASDAEADDFRVQVILALRSLGGQRDHTGQLIAALQSRSEQARISAATGARHFSLDRMRAPLLDRLRRDRSWQVREHAAESLLDLADIYPRPLAEHRAISKALFGPDAMTEKSLLATLLGTEPAPSPKASAGFAEAADKLDAAITERLAAGACPRAAPFDYVTFRILPVKDDERVAALVVEQSIGPCERTLAFVVFVRVARGLGRRFASTAVGLDPVQTSLDTRPTPLSIKYHRDAHSLTIRGLVLDTTQANVAFLASNGHSVAAQYRSLENLTFARHSRRPEDTFDGVASDSEIVDEVGTLVSRSPPLTALITPPR